MLRLILMLAVAVSSASQAAAQVLLAEPPPEAEPLPTDEPLPADDSQGPADSLFQMTPLGEISLDPKPNHPAPELTETPFLSGQRGDLRELRMEQGWTAMSMHWKASNFAHRPLYFEDVLLERHGQNHGLVQPAVSAAHFFGAVPLLPAMMVLEHPWECVYTLGYGRPGNCRRPLRERCGY